MEVATSYTDVVCAPKGSFRSQNAPSPRKEFGARHVSVRLLDLHTACYVSTNHTGISVHASSTNKLQLSSSQLVHTTLHCVYMRCLTQQHPTHNSTMQVSIIVTFCMVSLNEATGLAPSTMAAVIGQSHTPHPTKLTIYIIEHGTLHAQPRCLLLLLTDRMSPLSFRGYLSILLAYIRNDRTTHTGF